MKNCPLYAIDQSLHSKKILQKAAKCMTLTALLYFSGSGYTLQYRFDNIVFTLNDFYQIKIVLPPFVKLNSPFLLFTANNLIML